MNDLAVATLVPVLMEVPRGRKYAWVEGFKVVTPTGSEIQPYMRKREARAFCRERGWAAKQIGAIERSLKDAGVSKSST